MRQRPSAIAFLEFLQRCQDRLDDAFLQIGQMEEFIVFHAHTLFARLSPDTRLPLNTVFILINIIMSLRTFQHYLSRVFKKLAKLDMSRVYHITGQYTAFECRINLIGDDDRSARTILGTHLRSLTVSYKYSSLAIRAINDSNNRGRLTLFL